MRDFIVRVVFGILHSPIVAVLLETPIVGRFVKGIFSSIWKKVPYYFKPVPISTAKDLVREPKDRTTHKM